MIGLVPATTLIEAEAMRVARNSCRSFMTDNQNKITPEQQEQWFKAIDTQLIRPFVYWANDEPVGYGLIRKRDDRWVVSGGLLPESRGKGHGKRLFGALADIVNAFDETCWLDVLETNTVAIHLYQSLGFAVTAVYVDGHSVIFTMKRDPA